MMGRHQSKIYANIEDDGYHINLKDLEQTKLLMKFLKEIH